MNPALRAVLLFCALAMTAQQATAEEWRGLTPLRSTRADVVRLFGECANEKPYCEFSLENEEIDIEFSTPSSCAAVPPDTVLSIQRELLKETTFAALRLDTRRFKSFDPSLPRGQGYRGYIDEKAGLLLKTFGGEVFHINHIAPKQDWPVCQAYYRQPRRFVAVFSPHFPTVTVDCPETSRSAGEKVVITALYGRTGQRFFFTWNTTSGQILEGDGSRRIVLDTADLEGKVTVSVELNDGNQHTAAGSCTFNVLPRTRN